MSTTFTLPVSAGDHFDHGHGRSQSQSKQYARHSRRSSNRLAPPFSLPRIPSESLSHLSTESQNAALDPYRHHHNHHPSISQNRITGAPRFDPNGLVAMKKRSQTATDMVHPQPSPHHHHHGHRRVSKTTAFLLHSTENYSLFHGILADDDSRRIFYFMILNLAFMVVQSTYGILTGSLGLISDSIHMFFDCVALLVGVCAAVMSKWPPSTKFPYGYGKIDTLAGLGNGIFLMLISVEIVWEAIERLFAGANISRTGELLAVSITGLAVNLVGIFAFHGHHGHDHHHHDHGHKKNEGADHKHENEHKSKHGTEHEREHEHLSDHDHTRRCEHQDSDSDTAHHSQHHHHTSKTSVSSNATVRPASPSKKKTVGVMGHSHGNENMQGIYLHIMADALGSLSVVISTLLVRLTGWSGFDPLASCLIAVLIFASTIPLIFSTTKILLLSLNSDIEYNLRDILSGVSEIKGVVSYTVPRFWLEDIKKESDHEHHHHGHSGDHHHHHDHKHTNSSDSDCEDQQQTILGVIHVIANQQANLNDVRQRVRAYFTSRRMDVLVQMETEGEGRCYCGGGLKSG